MKGLPRVSIYCGVLLFGVEGKSGKGKERKENGDNDIPIESNQHKKTRILFKK